MKTNIIEMSNILREKRIPVPIFNDDDTITFDDSGLLIQNHIKMIRVMPKELLDELFNVDIFGYKLEYLIAYTIGYRKAELCDNKVAMGDYLADETFSALLSVIGNDIYVKIINMVDELIQGGVIS